MNIIVNGKPYIAADGCTVARLLEELGFGQKKLALEINGEIVPRSTYPQIEVRHGDKVEVIHAVGGG